MKLLSANLEPADLIDLSEQHAPLRWSVPVTLKPAAVCLALQAFARAVASVCGQSGVMQGAESNFASAVATAGQSQSAIDAIAVVRCNRAFHVLHGLAVRMRLVNRPTPIFSPAAEGRVNSQGIASGGLTVRDVQPAVATAISDQVIRIMNSC